MRFEKEKRLHFNDAQLAAIVHGDGPMMVLAGPGSGKTTILTYRLWHLIDVDHVPEQEILVLTYTRAAAQEMRSRFLQLGGTQKTDVTFGTFHSVFYRLLPPSDREIQSYDEIIDRMNRLMDRPSERQRLRCRFRYVIIDEFQDISPQQYEIIKKLTQPNGNLFIVGDDDQSIYGFRGAGSKLMLDFPKDYSQTETLILPINYRSRKAIVAASKCLIGYNRDRYDKPYCSAEQKQGHVRSRLFDTQEEESEAIARWASRPGQKAILFRTTFTADTYRKTLSDFGVTDDIHWIMQDLYLIRYGTEEQVFQRLHPKMPVSMLCGPQNITIEEFRYHLAKFRSEMPKTALKRLLRVMGYREVLEHEGSPISVLLARYEEIYEFVRPYEWTEIPWKQKYRKGKSNVHIMTMHAAKGLEFDEVWIPHIVANEMPHGKNQDPEEERRLLYVAMTRAKRRLILSASADATYSPFFKQWEKVKRD